MNLLINSTESFEEDLNKLSTTDLRKVVSQVEKKSQLLTTDKTSFFRAAYRPRVIQLAGGLHSSLYVLKIDPHIRVLLTVDDDPIFEQVIVTLLRVVRRDRLMRTFDSIVESLYQRHAADKHKEEGSLGG